MELISKMAADPKSRQASNFNVRTLTGKIFLWQSGSYSGILGKTNHSTESHANYRFALFHAFSELHHHRYSSCLFWRGQL